MKNRRGLAILLAIFAALALLVTLRRDDTSGLPATPPATGFFLRVFPDMGVLAIQSIRIEDPIRGDALTLTREPDGSWTALEVEWPFDQATATNIARTIVLLPYSRTIAPPADGNLAQYGFRPGAQLSILIVLINGDEHFVAIGDPVQSGPDFYAVVDDRAEIYLIQRSPIDYLAEFLDVVP